MQWQNDIWRIVSEHLDVRQMTRTFAEVLRERVGWNAFYLRRPLLERNALITVAEDPVDWSGSTPVGRTDLSREDFARLVAWCAERKPDKLVRGKHHPAWTAVPGQPDGEVIAGPLFSVNRLIGIAIFVAAEGRTFSEDKRQHIETLFEPLAVAMRNDERLNELQRLRDATMADNRALLTRLGRQDISEAIIGRESGLRDVMHTVEQVSGSDVSVLLLGETGCGKEVIARAIHKNSLRRDAPVVAVNCGAISPDLVDSELFGHERGSFTGAIATRKGYFEQADGGTLFLDEIGELRPDAQIRLLRVLQDGRLQRVGGSSTVNVDVRIIAATHRDLPAMVESGGFREDLWYRLSVFPITVPPLRERKHDIPALAAHFATRAGQRLGGHPLSLSREDLHLLLDYDWPGNVRELIAVIERAALLGDGQKLQIAHALGRSLPVNGQSSSPDYTSNSGTETFPTLDEINRIHIERALRLCSGTIEGPSGAATLLQIHPQTLRARMKKLGVRRNPEL